MNNYFCVLPFYGIEHKPRQNLYPCCLLPNNSNVNQIQNEMLAGQRPSACQKCWTLEDQGKISDRQIKNSAFDFYKNKDIRFIEEDCRNGNFSHQIIKLYTSNLCNSTCVTCDPTSSSAWATLRKVKTFKILDETTLSSMVYEDFVMLNFVGGEPLYEERNFAVLEQLVAVNNTDCFISFTTNGSVALNERQQSLLRKFTNLNMCLSIDGIGKRFEYIRYPLKWNTLLDNIAFFRDNNIHISVSYTISNINILYYQETVDWFKSQGLEYNYNLVSYPDYFSPASLPLEIKNQLGNDIVPSATHSVTDDDNFIKACTEIQTQDTLKKIKIKDYLPEFYNLIPQSLR
jgi:sulfatase maturation enzyme AslB (radical SAM superfamily)